MKITIDLDILIQEFITPDDFVFLWGLYTKYDLNALENYPNFKQLEEKGLIKIGENYILTEQGKKLFEPDGLESKFIQFYTSYPLRVSNGRGGIRTLRDNGTDTKHALACKEKYIRILKKDPKIHETILKAMRLYVVNESPYLKNIEVFLNQETWNKYIGVEENKKDNSNEVSI